MAGNVFGLNEVYDLQKNNATDLDLNIPGLEVGYFVSGQSGYPSPTHTNMFRFEFSTDTNSVPSNNINAGRYYIFGVSSEHAGYTCGGSPVGGPSYFNTSYANRIEFSNETTSSIANMPDVRSAGTTVWNGRYGYFCTGYIGPAAPLYPTTSRFDRLDFNVETWNVPSTNTSAARALCTGLINSSYGYVCGGGGGFSDVVDRFDFSNESRSNPITLPVPKDSAMGVSSPDYGYIVAGISPTPPYGSTVERLEFANETMSSPGNNMPVIRGFGGYIYNKNHAIIGLGIPPTGDPWATCTVDRLDFTTETASTLTPTNGRRAGPASIQANRPQVFKYVPGNSLWKEEPNYGYIAGGNPGPLSTVDRIDFSTETVTAPGPQLTQARVHLGATYNSSYGYFGGGGAGAPGNVCTIDRLDFSNETVVAPTTSLTQSRQQLTAVSSNSYGYYAGGLVPPLPVCTIDRIDFSNETTSNPPVSLTRAKRYTEGISSNSYGYFGGGSAPSLVCIIDRLDFSNETTSNPPASLTQAKNNLAAVSSSSYGYFGGGYNIPYASGIDRIDFSNETVNNLSATLTQARAALTATYNSSYGYFGGGYAPPSVCTIDRLDFTTETVTAPGPQLTQARFGLAAVNGGIATRRVGKATYGYWAGGGNPNNVCTIDRLDFTTETVTVPGPQLTQARKAGATISNNSYGYYGGGFNPTPAVVCTIDRLDFSNETVKANPGQLTQARRGLAGVSNSTYGYFGGGIDSSEICTIDRLDFSTETVVAPGTYQLTQARRELMADQSNSYGYFAGGTDGSEVCTIDRIEFSTETVSANPGQLTQARRNASAVSNNFYAYFAGGGFPGICTIDRLDFSSETVSANPGQLTQARRLVAGTQSSSYGYFGGGIGPADSSTIDRLDFSNDTVSLPSQKLTQARSSTAAFSNG